MAKTLSIRKDKMVDMTTGNPYKLMIMFALPLLIGNIFQQLYNMVDSIVVGNIVGDKALAAVGTGFPVIFMMSSLFMGIGTGATIMISQFYGAKDIENVSNTISTIYTAMIVGVIPLTILGVVISTPLLRLMRVPDDGTLEMASTYMIIIFIGMIGSLGYNINAGILQGLGDSKTSLIFLAIAAIINTVLDVILVFAGMGVAGAAIATIISQIVSWLFGIFYINRHYESIKIRPFSFIFKKDLFFRAMKIGIPSAIQQVLFSVGTMMMQSLVNSYGSSFMAGFNGANKIDTFAFMPITSFTSAMTTYTGQNVGANDYDRVKKGFRAGMIIAVGFSIAVSAILYPLSGFLMRMFSQEAEVISSGVSYLHCVLPFYFMLAMVFLYGAVMRGAGEMIIPMISSILSLWLARIPIAYLIAAVWGKEYIYLSYAAGWLIGILVSGIYYATGKWKKRRIIKDK